MKAPWSLLVKAMAKNPTAVAMLGMVLLGALLALCAFSYQLKVTWKDGQFEMRPATIATDGVPAAK